MRIVNYVLALAFAVLFFGCPARSIFPLFEEKDLVFDARLVGTWSNGDHKDTITFNRSGEKEYIVTLGGKATYKVQMG